MALAQANGQLGQLDEEHRLLLRAREIRSKGEVEGAVALSEKIVSSLEEATHPPPTLLVTAYGNGRTGGPVRRAAFGDTHRDRARRTHRTLGR